MMGPIEPFSCYSSTASGGFNKKPLYPPNAPSSPQASPFPPPSSDNAPPDPRLKAFKIKAAKAIKGGKSEEIMAVVEELVKSGLTPDGELASALTGAMKKMDKDIDLEIDSALANIAEVCKNEDDKELQEKIKKKVLGVMRDHGDLQKYVQLFEEGGKPTKDLMGYHDDIDDDEEGDEEYDDDADEELGLFTPEMRAKLAKEAALAKPTQTGTPSTAAKTSPTATKPNSTASTNPTATKTNPTPPKTNPTTAKPNPTTPNTSTTNTTKVNPSSTPHATTTGAPKTGPTPKPNQ